MSSCSRCKWLISSFFHVRLPKACGIQDLPIDCVSLASVSDDQISIGDSLVALHMAGLFVWPRVSYLSRYNETLYLGFAFHFMRSNLHFHAAKPNDMPSMTRRPLSGSYAVPTEILTFQALLEDPVECGFDLRWPPKME